jgi:NAD(P)-dependent dehydrogenase (short-subunit alcohol dehydrogenase family)
LPLSDKRVVVIGGSAGMGYATAAAAMAAGAHVTIAARSADKLAAARVALGTTNIDTAVLDATDENAVRKLFEQCGGVDHVVTSAAVVNRQPFYEVSAEAAHAAFESKFWGQFYAARAAAPHIRAGGSITLFSGISSRKGIANLVITGAINGAVEALTRSLALTLAPLRVNAVCPGFIDTPGHDDAAGRRRAVLAQVAQSIPARRVGRAEEVAQSVLYLMQSEFTTGTVIDIDGGHLAG